MQSMGIFFCDRCNKSIPESVLARSATPGAGGRLICPDCRGWIEGQGFAEELHFCDGCNVSVSIAEIREGRASFVAGRLLCPACAVRVERPAREAAPRGLGAGPRPIPNRTPSRPGRPVWRVTGALVLLLVAAGAVVAALFFPDRIAFWRGAQVERGAGGAGGAHAGAPGGGPAPGARPVASGPSADAGRAAILAALDRLEGRLGRLEEAVGLVAARDANRTPAEGRLERLEAGVESIAKESDAGLRRIEEEVGLLREGIEGLDGRVADLALRATPGPPAAEAPEGGAGGGTQPPKGGPGSAATGAPGPGETTRGGDGAGDRAPLEGILRDLRAPEAGRRFSALVELGRRGSREHVPVIAEVLLEDDDLVVRELAANLLGNLGDPAGIEPLIRSLRDPAASVVFAADDALRRITRRSSGMKRRMGAEARLDVVRKWEAWWEKKKSSRH